MNRQIYLLEQITDHYGGYYLGFVNAFNEHYGEKLADATTLSRQLSGKIQITNAWYAAYRAYFENLK